MAQARPPAGCLVYATTGNEMESNDLWSPDGADMAALREWCGSEANGLPLEFVSADDPEVGPKAAALFARDGFAVITDALSPEALALMQRTTQAAMDEVMSKTDGGRRSWRGGGRSTRGAATTRRTIERRRRSSPLRSRRPS